MYSVIWYSKGCLKKISIHLICSFFKPLQIAYLTQIKSYFHGYPFYSRQMCFLQGLRRCVLNGQIQILFCSTLYTTSFLELVSRQGSNSPRRISAASTASGYYSDDKERASFDSGVHGNYKSQHWRYSFRRCKYGVKTDSLLC